MSGGHFDYKEFSLKDEIFGYSDKPKNVFEDKEISGLVWDVLNLIHELARHYSGDTDEEEWLKIKANFKKKWLNGSSEERAKGIIDSSIDELKQELYKTFLPELSCGGDT